jgi:hypothetical protein
VLGSLLLASRLLLGSTDSIANHCASLSPVLSRPRLGVFERIMADLEIAALPS